MTSPVSPRALVVQHQDTCPPALLGGWLEEAGLTLDVRRPDLGDTLPTAPGGLAPYDAVLVLGGSMDAFDEAGHPWLRDTVSLVRQAIAHGTPTLGICLGHQLVARACGGTVARNPRGRALGVLPIGWTSDAAADPLLGALARADGTTRCLQWNQDVVTVMPPGAVLLAASPGGEPQVARFADRAWGIQAHPEADASVAQSWADDAAPDVAAEQAARTVAAVRDAESELSATWRPLAAAFAAIVTGIATGAATGAVTAP
ncbi:MAG: type 1 glutamine amidotransferase [Nocardioides sp.]|nr:type 1 glutamine amidotransferase [Nocardioides sp.]